MKIQLWTLEKEKLDAEFVRFICVDDLCRETRRRFEYNYEEYEFRIEILTNINDVKCRGCLDTTIPKRITPWVPDA